MGHEGHEGHAVGEPIQTSDFLAFPDTYLGGISLTTGWVAGAYGGARAIITAMLAAPGTVTVYSSGSALDGSPPMYLQSPTDHNMKLSFAAIASFAPFPGGASVASTSTVTGADLLVGGVEEGATQVRKYRFQQTAPGRPPSHRAPSADRRR